MENQTLNFIRPEDQNNVLYWSRKFGVDVRQLKDAILHTGTLNAKVVKNYLKRDSWFYHPVTETKRVLEKTINYIF